MTITNVTLPGHIFGGSVTITITTTNGVVGADIVGTGVGPNAELNQLLGPEIFRALGATAEFVLNHDAIDNSIGH